MAAIFVKLYMSLPIHRCIDLSNPLRIYRDSIFLKLFVIPGGNALPKKIQQGDFSATLPNRCGRYQGTTPTTWLNFYTPCKSQPTSLPYYWPKIDHAHAAGVWKTVAANLKLIFITIGAFKYPILTIIASPIVADF